MATTIWLNDRAQEIFENNRQEEERPYETIIRLLGDQSVPEDQGEEIVEPRIRASTSYNPQTSSGELIVRRQ